MTLQEAADRLHVHYMTAYRYVRTGRLPAERQGAQWTVLARDVDALAAPGRGRGGAAGAGAGAPARRRGQGRGRDGNGAGAVRASQLADRLVAGDEGGAWGIVDNALASTMQPDRVHLELLTPALEIIGDRWASGAATVADEHRATVVATRVVGRLGPRFNRRGPKRGSVVLGAPAGEEHGLPTAIVADFLRGAGFEAIDLGADTPSESFAHAASGARKLLAVLIGVTGPGHERSVRRAIAELRDADITVPVLVGGAAVPDADAAARLGADGWSGPDARAVVAAVEQIAVAGNPQG
jgi:excisionase family DNA binding protein